MKKQSMPDKKNNNIRQPILWPQYWNKRINEELKMHVDKINNLLVIYESNLVDDLHQKGKIGENYI